MRLSSVIWPALALLCGCAVPQVQRNAEKIFDDCRSGGNTDQQCIAKLGCPPTDLTKEECVKSLERRLLFIDTH